MSQNSFKLCPFVGRDMRREDIPALIRVEAMFFKARTGEEMPDEVRASRIKALEEECDRLESLRSNE